MQRYESEFTKGVLLLAALIASFPIMMFEPLIVLFVVAAALLTYGIRKLLRYRSVDNWIETSGKLIKTDIGTARVSYGQYSRPTDHYYPLAFFSYQHEGKEYTSNRYAVDAKSTWSTERETAEKAIEELTSKNNIQVFLNPKNPSDAVLNRNFTRSRMSHFLAVSLSGFILLSVGAFLWSLRY